MTTDTNTALPTAGPMGRRAARWAAKTGLDANKMLECAADAHAGYDNGCGRYSSGYEAGQAHADALPAGSTDRTERAWGDFLIDLHEAVSL